MAPTRGRTVRGKVVKPYVNKALPSPSRSRSRGRTMDRSTSAARSMSISRSRTRRIVFKPFGKRGRYSKSQGFLKTGVPTKKYLVRNNYVLNGVTTVYETSGQANTGTAGEIAYVGHSFPIYTMKENAWWAVLRHLFIKAGLKVENLYGAISMAEIGARNGDVITLRYRPTGTTAPLSTAAYTVVTTDNFNVCLNTFAGLVGADTTTAQFVDIDYVPNVVITSPNNKAIVRLENLTLHFNVKCDLKLQNQTTAVSADNEADDVNNVPLYGRTVEGPGMGPQLKGYIASTTAGIATNLSWLGHQNTGVIIALPNSGSNIDPGLREPLDYQRWDPVKKIGKIHLDPGQIKTSVIKKEFAIKFTTFMNMVNPALGDALTVPPTPGSKKTVNGRICQYRMFALEKMLDAPTSALRTSILVNYEHNIKIMTMVKEKRLNSTLPRYLKTFNGTLAPV